MASYKHIRNFIVQMIVVTFVTWFIYPPFAFGVIATTAIIATYATIVTWHDTRRR